MPREFNYDIMSEIKTRWSPRAFSGEKLSVEELMPLFEAARWAPSCFNEQPWRFVLATNEDELAQMRELLTADNRLWADKAPALALVLAHNRFAYNDKENYWHMFDAGTAWGFLSLEAERRGLITHAMGGFSRKRAQESFNIPEQYTIICVVAIGRMGEKADLHEKFIDREQPGARESLEDIFVKFDRHRERT